MSDSEYSESLDVNGQDESEGNDIHMQLLQQQQRQYFLHQQQQQQNQQQQQHNVSYMSYAGSTSSSSESSISSTSSDESDEGDSEDTLELAQITKEVLSLPRGLCENAAIFQEFFSLETWQELPLPVQNHLQQFLPSFDKILPSQMAAVEQTRTISMLFNNELQRFGETPLNALQQQLEMGNYRPDIKKLKQNILKSRRREQKFQHCERLSQIAKQMFLSRQRLLDSAYKSSPDTIIKAPLNAPNGTRTKTSHLFTDNKLSAIRARKRFYSEISQIAQELGLKEDVVLSADEEDEDHRLLNEEMKKDQQQLRRSSEDANETSKTSNSLAERCIYSTVFKKHKDIEDEEACRLQQKAKQSRLTNRSFREYLREHKRRKITEPTLPEFETSDIRLRDVCARAQMGGNFKKMFAMGKTAGRKPKLTPTATTTTMTLATTTSTSAVTTATTSLSTITSTTNSNITTATTSTATNTSNTPTATVTQSIALTSLPPPAPLPPSKLSEPPALVPIQPQPQLKKPETYQIVTTTLKSSPQKEYHHQQQQHSLLTSASLDMQHKLNSSHNSNDTLNISQFMAVTGNHADNLNLCIDDSSLLTGDHDAFNMLDNEVELQQEEVETFGNTCEETIPAFVIGNDVVLPSPTGDNNNDSKTSLLNVSSSHSHKQQQMDRIVSQPLPKLEPISRPTSLINPKSSAVTTNSNSSSTVSELIQETHACYFSLIRDFFCSTPNHRMRYDDLRHKIDVWLRNPITALNEWYSLAENWSNLLKSAINFLVGEFPDLPDEYVPYIEHKVQLNIYQWIGAGRDSDTRLSELCTLWMEKRKQPNDKQNTSSSVSNNVQQSDMKLDIYPRSSVENEDSREGGSDNGGGLTPPPPPPRCPTNWTVRAATLEEITEFQRQERERFEQPHKAYTYRMHGYESVVGPVKGIYTPLLALSKARGHSMMVGDRPNFVTILTLVRDATARLPNGEGTRAEISELLKCSQYINRDASENVLQTIVSGALDRMHTEHDPCVRYDPKRKIWIYLHRNRTEEEFERIHQQNQTIGKAKKLPQRKPKPLATTTTSAGSGKSSDNDNFHGESSNGSGNTAVTGSLLTMPALVPSNPIIVTNANTALQRQQQVLQQQLINANKCPPVPPLKYNIPPSQTTTAQPHHQQQQKSLLKTTIRAENKTISVSNSNSGNSSNNNQIKQHSFQLPQNKSTIANQNTTPIIVATPQGLQTVHVSNATSVLSSHNNNQQSQQQQQQNSTAQQHTNITANLAGKRVTLNKPIIINQVTATSSASSSSSSSASGTGTTTIVQQKLKSPQQIVQKSQLIQNRITLQTNQHQLLTQQQQQSNLIIPISMANNMTLNVQQSSPSSSSSSNTIDNNNQSLSTIANTTSTNTTATSIAGQQSSNPTVSASASASLTNKQNIIRLVPASNVKTLMNSPTTTQIVNRQRIISASSVSSTGSERPTTPQQKSQQTAGIQLLSSNGNVLTVAAAGGTSTNPAGSIVKMSPQQFATLQQKHGQQQQHIIVKQATGITKATTVAGGNKPHRVILGNTSIVGQAGQTKNIVLQQIPVASSSAVVVTPSSQTTTSTVATTTISGGKIQTINAKNLTPQQQRVLIQNLKQQQQQNQQQQTINQNQIQFKTVQVVGNTLSTGRTQTLTMATTTQQQQQQNTGKTTMVVVSQDNAGGTTTTQQNVTRILKTTTSPQLKSEISGTTGSGNVGSGARVITSSSGQIISLDSLIQKQGGTLRISGTGNANQLNKTNQIQQQVVAKSQQQVKQQQQQQTQQFAIVSVPNSIISLGSNSNFSLGQRIITTLAGGTSNNTSTSLVNLNTTKVTPSIVSTGSGRVITATAAGTKIITKQAPTTGTTGNIRVINAINQSASNINLATLQGKQVVLASGKTLNTITKAQLQSVQQQQQQNVVQTQQGNIVIGGQTLKLQQGNTNIQQLLQKSGNIITSQSSTTTTTPQLQTVIMGNQILRVQQLPQIVSTANRLNVSNTKTISNNMDTSIATTNSNTPKTIFVGSTGQTLRLQPASSTQQTLTNKNIIVQTPQQNPANKSITTSSAGNTTTPNRVVLAVQGGGQIFLSPNFQGGNINLKSLQNMKVVSLAQHPSVKLKDATATTSSATASATLTAQQQQQQQQTILKTTKSTTIASDSNV